MDEPTRRRHSGRLSVQRSVVWTFVRLATHRQHYVGRSLSIPAIVIGQSITALGAARSLARAGIPVYMSGSVGGFETKSRYFRPLATIEGKRILNPWDHEDGFDQLEKLPFDKAVLIPCSDVAAMWAANVPQHLQTRFLQCNSTKKVQTLLQDKRTFAGLCQQLDVPHPPHYIVESDDDLSRVPFEELENCFFKPFNSREFAKKYKVKGIRFNDRSEAEALWADVSQTGIGVFIQEYVPGGADQHYFIDGFRDNDGEIRACFSRRRRRIYPVDFGNSSYCHQVPIETVQPAWDALKKIVDHVDYRGIFSGEFKFDHRDGTYRIIEINTRVWVYVEFASWCGVNVCEMAYNDALGKPVQNVTDKRPGAGCVDLYKDYRSIYRSDNAKRDVPTPGVAEVARQWVGSKKAVFAWDDPMPALHWGINHVTSRWK